MFNNSVGYIFECRRENEKTNKSRLGVLENFHVLRKGTIQVVGITCCVNNNGIPLIPAYLSASSGFIPLGDYLKGNESVDDAITGFLRSKKPCFGVMDSPLLICNANIKYNIESGLVLPDISKVDFYSAKKVIDSIKEYEPDYKYNDCPAVICDRLVKTGTQGGKNYEVDESLIKGYRDTLFKYVTQANTVNRFEVLLME